MDKLENVLESILFVSGEAVAINDITSKIDASKAEIKNAVKKLKNKYNESSGIQLLEFNDKLQFSSNGQYVDSVSAVLNPIRQRNLSKSTLETVSIVAYKQPVTRLEIEQIRGANSDYAINILLEHNLICIVGRKDTVGKPVLFGTTDEFLKRFNISSLDDLPDYDSLMEKVKAVKSIDDRLYNHFEINESDEEMEAKLGLAPDQSIASEAAIASQPEDQENPEDLDTIGDDSSGDDDWDIV